MGRLEKKIEYIKLHYNHFISSVMIFFSLFIYSVSAQINKNVIKKENIAKYSFCNFNIMRGFLELPFYVPINDSDILCTKIYYEPLSAISVCEIIIDNKILTYERIFTFGDECNIMTMERVENTIYIIYPSNEKEKFWEYEFSVFNEINGDYEIRRYKIPKSFRNIEIIYQIIYPCQELGEVRKTIITRLL